MLIVKASNYSIFRLVSAARAINWLIAILGLAVMPSANANYNSNLVGTPIAVMTYEGGRILFSLDTQPGSNGSCNSAYFELDPENNTDPVIGRLYARLLVAYTQQERINVGYDNVGACGTAGYIHAYRVG